MTIWSRLRRSWFCDVSASKNKSEARMIKCRHYRVCPPAVIIRLERIIQLLNSRAIALVIIAALALATTACAFHEPPSLLDVHESRVIVRIHVQSDFGYNVSSPHEIAAEATRGCALFEKTAKFVSKSCSVYYGATTCVAEDHLFLCQ